MTTPRADRSHLLQVLRTPSELRIGYRRSRWLPTLVEIRERASVACVLGCMPIGFWLAEQNEPLFAEGTATAAVVEAAALAGLVVMTLSAATCLLLRLAAPMRVDRECDLTIGSTITIDRDVLAVKDRSVHDTAEFQVAIASVFGVYIHGGIGGTQRGMLEIELQNGDSHLLLMRAPLSVIEIAAEAIIDELEYAAMVRDIDGGHGQLPLFGRRAA